jgi:hypothetical protein
MTAVPGGNNGRMRVAVLGGGFQGCCTAIELARRGAQVCLYEREANLLNGAATANEGKIHLGYVYARDRSLATARTMLRGALSFAPLLRQFLDADPPAVSDPFIYAVHRDSQIDADAVAAHLAATHELALEHPCCDRYFGIDLGATPPRRLTKAALERQFDTTHIVAAFDTPEIAINMVAAAKRLRSRIAEDPRIEVRTGRKVTAVENHADRPQVCSIGAPCQGVDKSSFDCVINATWGDRLAIDATRGLHAGRKWLHRFKHGIRFRLSETDAPPSVTVMLGPFGDVVRFAGGACYLSWYPACMTSHSVALRPPDWRTEPCEPLRTRIVAESFAAMAALVSGLRNVSPQDIAVRGGVIFAWGATDIDDRDSELHRRCEIGVHSYDRYHSIDTGKLTMAPYFAKLSADRILPQS